MHILKNSSQRFLVCTLVALLMFTIFSLRADASINDDEDMNILRMYFKEGQLVIFPTRSLEKLSETAENIGA